MPRTRSRQKTQEKFLQAVLDLIAERGFSSLGINAIAKKAGADKVLIYRYFGDFAGLMLQVAESRQWLPTATEILNLLPAQDRDGPTVLRTISRGLVHQIQTNKTSLQLMFWRKAEKNPLTEHFTREWHNLWRELPTHLAEGLGYNQRIAWEQACELTALMVEAELADEAIAPDSIDAIAADLVLGEIFNGSEPVVKAQVFDDVLPTNLL
jgi:AcrR family transcriptional regulator